MWKTVENYLTISFSGSVLAALTAAAGFQYESISLLIVAALALFFYVSADSKRPFLTGWLYGFFFTAVCCWWLSMLEGYRFIPLVLAAYEGVFYGLAVMLARWVSGKHRSLFYLVMPASFTFFEFLRGYGAYGFPWASTGFFLTGTPLRQNLMFYGVYGSGFLLALLAGMIPGMLANRKLAAVAGAVVLMLAAPLLFDVEPEVKGAVRAVAAQDIILVEEKHSSDPAVRNMLKESFFDLYQKALDQQPGLILMPETAYPETLKTSPAQQRFYRDALLYDAVLVIGAERKEKDSYFNTLYFFDQPGIKTYDKRFLVPFGEFVPGRRYLDWIPDVADSSSFTPGKDREVIDTSIGRAGAGICWESALPFIGRAAALKGAEFLLFSTNDNWFLFSNQSAQHWRHTKAQADMSGLAVLQSGNAGVTGYYFDGAERTLPVWSHEVLAVELPVVRPKTGMLKFAAAFEFLAILLSGTPLLLLFSSLVKKLLNLS